MVGGGSGDAAADDDDEEEEEDDDDEDINDDGDGGCGSGESICRRAVGGRCTEVSGKGRLTEHFCCSNYMSGVPISDNQAT